MDDPSPTQDQLLAWMSELSNWGRCGAEDDRVAHVNPVAVF
jgi:hypothetical protein